MDEHKNRQVVMHQPPNQYLDENVQNNEHIFQHVIRWMFKGKLKSEHLTINHYKHVPNTQVSLLKDSAAVLED